MRVLVTGATGCLGRALVSELADRGHEVIALVRERVASQNDSGFPEQVVVDLASQMSWEKLPPQCDAIIHLAQSRNYRRFPEAARDVFAINTAATLALADYSVRTGVRQFVYASTGSVYQPQDHLLSEISPSAPTSFYVASKLAAEQVLTPFGAEMNVFIPRLFNVYGPGQSGMLVDGIAQRIRTGQPVTLHGECGFRLTPTFSFDVASIISQALDQCWTGLFNVAGPDVVSLRSLALAVGRALERTPVFVPNNDPPPSELIPDVSKLLERFEAEAFTSLDAGLRETFGNPACSEKK